jgi:HK97 family phage major capsid protein
MSQLELTAEDQAVIAELSRRTRAEVESAVDPLRKQVKTLMERSSRAPGSDSTALAAPPITLSRQLLDDGGFQAFIKSNKTQHSAYATELRLPLNRKAAITGLSPTEHVGAIWGPPVFPLRVKSLLPQIPTSSGAVEFTVEQSFTPSGAIVPEGALKPQMAATYVEQTSKAVTIAQYCKASVQSLADTPMLAGWLDGRLSYAVALKEEAVIVGGDATAVPPVNGLLQIAPTFVYTPSGTDQGMDVIARAAGQLWGAGYPVDGVILNSADYVSMRLLKSSTNSYIFMGTPTSAPDDESLIESPMKIWEIPTVIAPAMPQGKFLIGSFQLGAALFVRETLNIQLAFQNEDDFIRNLITMRGELRSALAVMLPSAFLQGTLPAGSLTAAAAPAHNAKK